MHIIFTLLVIWACYAVFGAKLFAKLILGSILFVFVFCIGLNVIDNPIRRAHAQQVDDFSDLEQYKITELDCSKVSDLSQYIAAGQSAALDEERELGIACVKAGMALKEATFTR